METRSRTLVKAVVWNVLGLVSMALVGLAWAEGASLARAELALRGWREAGLALAESEAGAEELYLTGRAVQP